MEHVPFADVEAVVVAVLAPAVRAPPEGTPQLLVVLVHARASVRPLPLPRVRVAAANGAPGQTAAEAVPAARRQAPGLVLVRAVVVAVQEACRAPLVRGVRDQTPLGAAPLLVVGLPEEQPSPRGPAGVPGALPRGLQRVAIPAGRAVRTANGEVPGPFQARDVAPPAEATAKAVPAGTEVQGPLGGRRAVLKLAPLPRGASTKIFAALGPLVVAGPVTVSAAQAIKVRRHSVLAGVPATATAAGRVAVRGRVGRQGEVRLRVAPSGADGAVGRRHVRVHRLSTRAEADEAAARAGRRTAPGAPAGVLVVAAAVGRDVPRPALLAKARHPLVGAGPNGVRRGAAGRAAARTAAREEVGVPTATAASGVEVVGVAVPAGEGAAHLGSPLLRGRVRAHSPVKSAGGLFSICG